MNPTVCSLDFGFLGLQCLLDNRAQIWLMPFLISPSSFLSAKLDKRKVYMHLKSALQIEMTDCHLLEETSLVPAVLSRSAKSFATC